jgi:hypothetical protein
MSRRRFLRLPILAASLVIVGLFAIPTGADEVPRINPNLLRSMLESPDLVILDVRTARGWEESNRKIPGAFWENYEEVDSWADRYPKELMVVLY